jgi:hypothetical protein
MLYLSCCGRVDAPAVPVGRLPSYVLPRFVGGAASSAYGWVRKKRLDFRAYLGPLKAGDGSGLFGNYRVTRQRPAAGARLALGQRTRSAKGSGGGFRRTPLTVWGAQPRHVAPCTPPPGYSVIASSPQAVITSHQFQETGTPFVGWYGCLSAVGKQRLLTSAVPGGYAGYYTSLGQVVLAGRFAAFSFFYEDKYFNCSSYVDIYDLGTGGPGQVYAAGCPSYPQGTPAGLDSLSLNSNGFAAWRETQTYPPPSLHGMSCPSVSLCVAVDNVGNVLTTTAPAGGRDAWSITNVDGQIALNGVSCPSPSPSLCVAVDESGNEITSTDPTGGPAAWTVTHVDSSSKYITAVSCPSASMCVATDGAGNVITSTDPTGGSVAWKVDHVVDGNSAALRDVSCPSTSLCVATDGVGDVITSTYPTGGAGAWTVTRVSSTSNSPYAISCPSTSLCVAGQDLGNLLTSTNPTGGASAWTAAKIQGAGDVQAMSCTSASLCVAGDNISNLLISTDPTGGGAAWTAAKIPTGSSVIGVSCPSTSLCVAGDTGGNVLTATNPAGGSNAWSSALIDTPPSCNAQSCLVARLYAHDNRGTRVLDSTPPGAGNSLMGVKLSGNLLTWSNNGTPHQATLR